MTPREYELFREGRTIRDDFLIDLLTWLQVNLINIHIPRGKSRARFEKLRPPKPKDRVSLFDELNREAEELREELEPDIPAPEIPDISEDLKKNPKAVYQKLLEFQEHYNEQRRARESERESKAYWKSAEGRMMQKVFEDPEGEWATPEQSRSNFGLRRRAFRRR